MTTEFSSAAEAAAHLSGDETTRDRVDALVQGSAITTTLLLYRNRAGLTQEAVARAMGCSTSKISRLESGTDADVSWSDIVRYADAVNVHPTLRFEARDIDDADRARHHVLEAHVHLQQLAALATNSGFDPEIRNKINTFYGEVLFSFLVTYLQQQADRSADAAIVRRNETGMRSDDIPAHVTIDPLTPSPSSRQPAEVPGKSAA